MKKLILVTLVLCMALSACTKAEVGKAPTAESAAASSVESTASGGESAASEVSLPEKTKTAAHVTKTLSSGVFTGIFVKSDISKPYLSAAAPRSSVSRGENVTLFLSLSDISREKSIVNCE